MTFDHIVTVTLLVRFVSLLSVSSSSTTAFSFHQSCSSSSSRVQSQSQSTSRKHTQLTQLSVSIGLGPEKQDDGAPTEKIVLVPGVDYEIPDHESFRTSRRAVIDETCDAWFHSLLGTNNNDDHPDGDDTTPFLGDIAMAARSKLLTPVELKNEVRALPLFWAVFYGIMAFLSVWNASFIH